MSLLPKTLSSVTTVHFLLSSSNFLKGENHLAVLFLKWSSISTSLCDTYYHLLLLIVLDNGVYLLVTWLLIIPTLVSSLLHSWILLLRPLLIPCSMWLFSHFGFNFICVFLHPFSDWIDSSELSTFSLSAYISLHSLLCVFLLSIFNCSNCVSHWDLDWKCNSLLKVSHLNVSAVTKCNLS